jgi:hypothetical protein
MQAFFGNGSALPEISLPPAGYPQTRREESCSVNAFPKHLIVAGLISNGLTPARVGGRTEALKAHGGLATLPGLTIPHQY